MPQRRTILCFGDSNTHGTCPIADLATRSRYDPATRWPGVLRAAVPDHVTVIEEGHPGRTTVHDDPIEGASRNGLRALTVALESHAPVDLLIHMLGTNDFKARFSVTAADVARSLDCHYRTIAASAAGPGGAAPAVLAIAPPPIAETGCLAGMFEGGAGKSLALAGLLRPVAESSGAAFLDAGEYLETSALDGVHFEAAGHAALGRAVSDFVVGWLARAGGGMEKETGGGTDAQGD